MFNKHDDNTVWLFYNDRECWCVGTVEQLARATRTNIGGGTAGINGSGIFAMTAPRKGLFKKRGFQRLLQLSPWRVLVNGRWTEQRGVRAEVYVPPVVLVGATGINRDAVNGEYTPTEETSGGQMVLSNRFMRLHYVPDTRKWWVSSPRGVGHRNGLFCGQPVSESGITGSPASVQTWTRPGAIRSTLCSAPPNTMIVTGACQRQGKDANGNYVMSTTTYRGHVVYVKKDAGRGDLYLRIAQSGHWCVSVLPADTATDRNIFWSVAQGVVSPLHVAHWQWVDTDNGHNYVVSSTMCVIPAPN